ncbi:NUDIX domain-containing protein [Pseudooceanicola sp. 200-1SW]|uniref:NUDIX domain-containing protein n=1 Tax=Pseudooceanicola sp. 200-1SW TaxID=3425949 RepID=UPI003D7F5C63
MGCPLFLYGPLCLPVMMQIVAGTRPAEAAARLEGYRAAPRESDDWPVLVQDPGTATQGIVLRDLADEVAARIAHYADAYGLVPAEVVVEVDGAPLRARAFRPEHSAQPVAPGRWSLEDWAGQVGEEACHTAHEVMKLRGRFQGSDLRFRLGQIRARAAARVAAERYPARHDLGCGPTDPWVQELHQQDDHAGYFIARTFELRHQTFAGGPSQPIRREVFLAPDAAIVLPYDPRRDRVLLVEQFRMGPYGRGEALPWMLEPVAGRVDPGETPEACARREAREEAGLELEALHHVSSSYPSPGCLSEFHHCYIGLCDLPETGLGAGGLDEEAEDIRTHVLSFERAMELVSSGEARNAPLVLTLLWLATRRSELRGAA